MRNAAGRRPLLAVLSLIAILAAAAGCSIGTGIGDEDVFLEADRPFFRYDAASDYYWCEPWNRGKGANAALKYPLVVFLHGSGGAGNIGYLGFLGYDSDDGHDDRRAKDFQLNHPCYVLVPQTPGSWDDSALISLIDAFRKGRGIDGSRIYLIGYSMGGWECYPLADAYYEHDGTLFAAIIRLAGQGQSAVKAEVSARTAIWLHVGLEDDAARVESARESFAVLQARYPRAFLTIEPPAVPGVSGTTRSLVVGGAIFFRETEYAGVGHGIATLPFEDPAVIEWLFSQRAR
jgi:predicted peptidase